MTWTVKIVTGTLSRGASSSTSPRLRRRKLQCCAPNSKGFACAPFLHLSSLTAKPEPVRWIQAFLELTEHSFGLMVFTLGLFLLMVSKDFWNISVHIFKSFQLF